MHGRQRYRDGVCNLIICHPYIPLILVIFTLVIQDLEFPSGTPLKARLVNTNLTLSHKVIVCCLLSQPGRGAVPEVLEGV